MDAQPNPPCSADPRPKPPLSPARKLGRRVLLITLVLVAVQQLWRHGHDYIFAEKFAAVVPGKIYRGAWQQDWPMRRIIRNEHIKTIVALAHPPDHPLVASEKALSKELGCTWVHVPIVDDRTALDGKLLFDRIEEAASLIADPKNQPVYFHCHHGINRASMVQMAYRMLYCDWTLEQATEEIAQTFGLTEVNHGPDYRHMADFYRSRVLPRRAQALAKSRARRTSDPSPVKK